MLYHIIRERVGDFPIPYVSEKPANKNNPRFLASTDFFCDTWYEDDDIASIISTAVATTAADDGYEQHSSLLCWPAPD